MKTLRLILPILVATILILGTTSLTVNIYRISQVHWPYHTGQELTFRLQVFGYRYYGLDNRIPYSDLNNTVLNVNITSLPIPYTILIRNGFLQTMEHIKTISYLENGAGAPTELNTLVSRSLIPLGVYDMIDNWFIDTPEDSSMHDTYISSRSGSQLSFGYSWNFIDEFHGWNCFINMTSGYPVKIEIWEREICPGTDEDFSIVLTLLSPL